MLVVAVDKFSCVLAGPVDHHPHPCDACDGRVVHAWRTSWPRPALSHPRCCTRSQGIM